MAPRRFIKKLRPVARNCQFCDNKTHPEYKEPQVLAKYISERGKLLGQARTGICSKHQRELALAVKYARHVAFLPFIVRA